MTGFAADHVGENACSKIRKLSCVAAYPKLPPSNNFSSIFTTPALPNVCVPTFASPMSERLPLIFLANDLPLEIMSN
ncbi:hypothetical protein ACTXT7_009428 [Hymenolepis weldensis]